MANQPSFIKDFIEIYRKHNCLWQVKSPAYANKHLRSKAYDDLLRLFKAVDKEATIDSVKNKINNMRSAFRKELKKVRESKRSGMSSDEVYTPSLWYFDSLLFTVEHEQCRETMSSCSDLQEDSQINEDNETQEETESEHEITTEAVNPLSPPTPISVSSRTSPPTVRKAAKRQKKDLILEKAHEVLSRPDNEFRTVGANVAWKLERMGEDQRNIAEHLINTILHYGITNKLNDNTTIQLQPQAPNYYGGTSQTTFDYNSTNFSRPQTRFIHTQPQVQPHTVAHTQSQMRTYTLLQTPNETRTQPNYQQRQVENQTDIITGEENFDMTNFISLNSTQ